MSEQSKKQMTYADAGVDIDAGNLIVLRLSEIWAGLAVCLH